MHKNHHNERLFMPTFAYLIKVCSFAIMGNENQYFHNENYVFCCELFSAHEASN